MRTVRDGSGTHYILLKESADASLVRDPKTGTQRHVSNDDLEPVEGTSPLETAANAVPEAVRTVVTATHDDRALGLLVELDTSGPLTVHELLDDTDLCESDLHGLLAEFKAAGLIDEVTMAGRRGYDTTTTATDAIAVLRSDG